MNKPYLTVTKAAASKRYDPEGIYGLKLAWERPGDYKFFRSKVSGSLSFAGKDHEELTNPALCCQRVAFLLRQGGGEIITPFSLNTGSLTVNVGLCTSTANTFEFQDAYSDVFRLWETPINVLTMDASAIRVLHQYRKVVRTNGVDKPVFELVGNNRFRWLTDLTLYLVKQTLTGIASQLAPTTVAQLSTAMSETQSSITGRLNMLKRLAVCQASDAMQPLSAQSATGLLGVGKNNEDMAITLKQLLNDLAAMFDLDWFIDPLTQTFRIEHRSFFDNGYSYGKPRTGIDLRLSQYTEARSHWWPNYQTDYGSLPGVTEVKLSLNEAVFASKQAYPVGYVFSKDDPGFVAVDDFTSATTRYDSPCLSTNEKGELTRRSVTADLFCTYWSAVTIGDESVDLTKWFLCEIVPFLTATGYVVEWGTAERRNVDKIPNANLTASALIRSYHRHNASFDTGIQNEREGFAGKSGYNRKMYGTPRIKRFEPISVPFCAGIDTFDPTALVILPDGGLAQVSKAEISLANETLTLTLTGHANCSAEVFFPPVTPEDPATGEGTPDGTPVKSIYPKAGILLRKEDLFYPCENFDYNHPDEPPTVYEIPYIRSYFADGYGGEYFTNDRDSC